MKKQAMNPYLPLWEYIPDGEPRLFDGRVYVYGSREKARGTQFCIEDQVVWSAPAEDLSDWRREGVAFSVRDVPGPDGGALFAPDCVRGPDGRYYYYVTPCRRQECAVAVSDSPGGPFTFLSFVNYPDGTPCTDQNLFDPGVLVDDDGRVYLYTGFVPGLPREPQKRQVKTAVMPRDPMASGRVFELAPDMHTILRGPVDTIPGEAKAVGTSFEGHGFFEASSPRKVEGDYLLVYSSVQSHELCYAKAPGPMGPWSFMGTLVSNADFGVNSRAPMAPWGNTHGSLVQVGEQWYIFYHRQTHGTECSRQGCAEPLRRDADGRFLQAEITCCGLNGGPLAGLGSYSAAYACHLFGAPLQGKQRMRIGTVQRENQPHIYEEDTDGTPENARHMVANITRGTVAGFKYFALGAAGSISLTLRSDCAGTVQVFTDEACTQPVSRVDFTATGGEWQCFTAPFAAPAGTAPLYFRFELPGRADWLEFALLEK